MWSCNYHQHQDIQPFHHPGAGMRWGQGHSEQSDMAGSPGLSRRGLSLTVLTKDRPSARSQVHSPLVKSSWSNWLCYCTWANWAWLCLWFLYLITQNLSFSLQSTGCHRNWNSGKQLVFPVCTLGPHVPSPARWKLLIRGPTTVPQTDLHFSHGHPWSQRKARLASRSTGCGMKLSTQEVKGKRVA